MTNLDIANRLRERARTRRKRRQLVPCPGVPSSRVRRDGSGDGREPTREHRRAEGLGTRARYREEPVRDHRTDRPELTSPRNALWEAMLQGGLHPRRHAERHRERSQAAKMLRVQEAAEAGVVHRIVRQVQRDQLVQHRRLGEQTCCVVCDAATGQAKHLHLFQGTALGQYAGPGLTQFVVAEVEFAAARLRLPGGSGSPSIRWARVGSR